MSWEQAQADVNKYNNSKSQIQGELSNVSFQSDVEVMYDLVKNLSNVWNTDNGGSVLDAMISKTKAIDDIFMQISNSMNSILNLSDLQASYYEENIYEGW